MSDGNISAAAITMEDLLKNKSLESKNEGESEVITKEDTKIKNNKKR